MKRLARWLYERIPVRPETLQKPVHLKGWLFCLGGTPLLLFGIMAATGILLTFYYVPYPMHAYESIQAITYKVRFGWFVRGIHRAASHLMVFTVMLHMIRVFVTRAYRKPRELNWVIGVALFLTILAFGFTGYSLVYDQLSYWATTVGTSLIGQTPVIGPPLLYLIRGGVEVNPNTLSRFYNFHVGVLPTLFTLLLIIHIIFIRMHGVARLQEDPRTETYHFFPDHVLRETIIGLLLLIGLVTYVIYFPPGIEAPANPAQSPTEIRPEWYFFPSYRWLKIVPLQVGLWTSFLFVMGMFAWPFIDAWFERLAPNRGIGRVVGISMFLFTLILLVWEAVFG
jgi:quinol-cytochrome oxidoreductase complex cytochrome b subunit